MTFHGFLAQLVRAAGLHPVGRGFESLGTHTHHYMIKKAGDLLPFLLPFFLIGYIKTVKPQNEWSGAISIRFIPVTRARDGPFSARLNSSSSVSSAP